DPISRKPTMTARLISSPIQSIAVLSERETSRKLERPRTAGAERRTVQQALLRLAKRRAGEVEAVQRQVADIQDVESFADEPELIAFVKTERFAHANILGGKVVPQIVRRREPQGRKLLVGRDTRRTRGSQRPGVLRVVLVHQPLQVIVAEELV